MIVGVDPGKSGALAFLEEDGRIAKIEVMPLLKSAKRKDEYDTVEIFRMVAELIERDPGALFIIEKTSSLPAFLMRGGQRVVMGGSSANYQRGWSMGFWEAATTALGISTVFVAPKRWQAIMLTDVATTDTKQAAAIVARRRWPDVDWRISERGRKPHEGKVDAALIGEWGRLHERPRQQR